MTNSTYSQYRKAFAAVLTLFTAIFLSTMSHAAPKPELWDRWQVHDPDSTLSVDHSPWDLWLGKYVHSFGDSQYKVAYKSVGAMDRVALGAYITSLLDTPVSRLNKSQQLAYWINLYNSLTVQVILDAYPVLSIRDIDISPGFFSSGPWDKKLVKIEEEPVSLNDIEHRILRPIWQDPRLHYALNCASIGCPNLGMQAIQAGKVEEYLEGAAQAFINHPRAVRLKSGKVYASSIYKWFRDDFGGSEEQVLQHIRLYADASLLAALEGRASIHRYNYDWALNGVEQPAVPELIQQGS